MKTAETSLKSACQAPLFAEIRSNPQLAKTPVLRTFNVVWDRLPSHHHYSKKPTAPGWFFRAPLGCHRKKTAAPAARKGLPTFCQRSLRLRGLRQAALAAMRPCVRFVVVIAHRHNFTRGLAASKSRNSFANFHGSPRGIGTALPALEPDASSQPASSHMQYAIGRTLIHRFEPFERATFAVHAG